MKKFLLIFIIIFSTILLFADYDYRYMNSPLNTGYMSLFYNPSFLGRTDTPWYSWELFRLNTGITNNLISYSFLAFLFNNSATAPIDSFPVDTINEEKKQAILHYIGPYYLLDQYLRMGLPLFGFKIGLFGFGFDIKEGSSLQIPDAFFDIMLYGNQFDSTYDFKDLKFETQEIGQFAFGVGGGVDLENNGRLNFGLSLSYLAGVSYFNLYADSFYFQSDSSFLRVVTRMNLDYAIPFSTAQLTSFDNFNDFINDITPGFSNLPGHGFDLTGGVSWNIDDRWMVEFSWEHFLSRIFWKYGARRYTFFMTTDSLNVVNLHRVITTINADSTIPDDQKSDSIISSLLGDSLVYNGSDLTTFLEPQINVGVSYSARYQPFNVFARYSQGFKETSFSTKRPKLSLGLQYTAFHFLLLESMATFGGRETFRFNAGLGFNFGNFTSDLSISQDHGLVYYTKGAHLNMNSCSHSNIISVFSGTIIDSITEKPLIAKVEVIRDNPLNKKDTFYSDSLGKFKKYFPKTNAKVIITAEKYDTIIDSFFLKANGKVNRVYKMNPSMGTLIVQVISGITKKPIENASVIFTDGDTLYTDTLGNVTKRLDEGTHAVTVKSNGRDDVVFTIDIERGKDYKQIVEMFPTHGKLIVKTFNATTLEPVNSVIRVFTLDMKTLVDSFTTGEGGLDTTKAIKKGFYNIKIDPIPPKYIKQDKFNVEIKGGIVSNLDVGLLKEKMVFVFNNILFDLNKATLRPESYPVCDSLATIMKENPSIKVEISGHTDSRGSNSYNKKLSQARAESVRNYLISVHKISPNRIIAVGFGEEKPIIFPEKNEDDYQKNRRVEFKVLQGE